MTCVIDQTTNSAKDICWARGDSDPKGFVIVDANGNPVNITGFTFILTVDSLKNPTDTSTQIFALTGVVTNGPQGTVQFIPTTTQTDIEPKTYFYDIQQINLSSQKKTLVKGRALIVQDITKA